MNRIVPDRIGIYDDFPKSDVELVDSTLKRWATLRPLHDRVLVQRFPADEQTRGGIILPDVGKEKPLRGIVVAAGPGKKEADGVFRETTVKPGDIVLFSASVNVPYADLICDGDLVMMAEADIIGILALDSSDF